MNSGHRRESELAGATLLPLAVALALASGQLGAVTSLVPGNVPLPPTGGIAREDGTPLRVAIGAWHADAAQSMSPPSPSSTVRTVTNCDDDGPGSLRDVLRATASGDTVDLTQLSCSRISLTTGAIVAAIDTVAIEGPASRAFTIDGNDADRVMLHFGAGGLLLRNLTLAHGRHVASGTDVGVAGCLASAGYVTLDHSTISNCAAAGEGAYGGCVYAYSLILASSTLSACDALGTHPANGTAAFGGAAFVYQIDLVESTVTASSARHHSGATQSSYDIGGGIATINGGLVIDSTIDSNTSDGRGGGLSTFGDLLVRNSTISGNTAQSAFGGGLFVRHPGSLDARNSTITANRAPDGAGVFATSTQATLTSTIIAGNIAGARGNADFSGSRGVAITGSGNLIGEVASDVIVPPDSLRGDPHLLPLASNGGATRTHALRGDSPGIDAGNNDASLSSDQRGSGYPRVVGTAADIGAFEYDGPTEIPSGAPSPARVPALGAWASGALLALLALCGLRASHLRRRHACVARDR
ncbi:MAG: choice-of-anchor Q domain-containing protein [Rhodanobacteraceae bacterium]